jgi:chitin disaccharide deacetylase
MTINRYLIVNADDFGQSSGVNAGIIWAHEQGIVTSASLMTRWPTAVEAAEYGRSAQDFSLGLHVDLGEWSYQDDAWVSLYEVVPTTDRNAVADEIMRQLDVFRQLMRHDPTHLDSHQHVHHHEPVRSILVALAHDLNVPLRHYTPGVRYCGDFYGQTAKGMPFTEAIGVPQLVELLIALPPGITELACHPGYPDNITSMYRDERHIEVRTLCHPQVRATIADTQIQLRSFAAIAGITP